jgi:hypothetical protein
MGIHFLRGPGNTGQSFSFAAGISFPGRRDCHSPKLATSVATTQIRIANADEGCKVEAEAEAEVSKHRMDVR